MNELTIAQIGPLLAVAQVSIAMRDAEMAVAAARSKYLDRLQKFERKNGRIGILDKNCALHAEAIAYTAGAYEGFRAACRNLYNVKRRWRTACAKVQLGGQH